MLVMHTQMRVRAHVHVVTVLPSAQGHATQECQYRTQSQLLNFKNVCGSHSITLFY